MFSVGMRVRGLQVWGLYVCIAHGYLACLRGLLRRALQACPQVSVALGCGVDGLLHRVAKCVNLSGLACTTVQHDWSSCITSARARGGEGAEMTELCWGE